MTEMLPLNPLTLALSGSGLIEASAGTGKTWTLAALYVRLVLGHGDTAFNAGVDPKQLLVLTFTRAATRELRERIRTRLADTAELLFQAKNCGSEAEVNALIAAQQDHFLQALLKDCVPQLDETYQRCKQAAQSMDLAAIYTINSFCQRSLKRFAFAAGHAFEQQLETDTSSLDAQIQKDYWRCFMQPLPLILLQQVGKFALTEPSAFGWAIRDNQIQAKAEQRAFPASITKRQPALEQEVEYKLVAQNALQEQWPRFNDWLEEQLAQGNLDSRSYQANPFSVLAAFIEKGDVDANTLFKFTADGFKWKKGQQQQLPANLDAPDRLAKFLAAHDANQDFPLTELLQHAADWMAAEQEKRLQAQSTITFDTMVTHLARALDGDSGKTLADQLFAAYPCALIDEFQDTDPDQYHIFQQIYQGRSAPHVWLMIGDPKQSIYGWRSADINTYLAASKEVDHRYTLSTNFRSSAAMVAAANHLFTHSTLKQEDEGVFGIDAIRYHQVAAKGNNHTLLLNGVPATPLTLVCPPQEKTLAGGAAAELLTRECANRIAQLLQRAQAGKAVFHASHSGQTRALQPDDIACLVRSGKQANTIKQALLARGVDAVILSDKNSVFESDTARDLYWLLCAIAQPADGRLARRALATSLLAYDSDELAAQLQQDDHWAAQLRQLRLLHDVWLRQGVLPMLHRMVQLLALPQRQRDERVLTDLFHLAELLQQASAKLDGMEALTAWLEGAILGKIGSGQEGDSDQNAYQLRLENERNRVIIMTLHGAKGLEFPLVFMPFACLVDNPKHDKDPAEDMRLLYVGITRAVHACWLGLVACRNGSGKEHQLELNALGRLMFGSEHQDIDAMDARLTQLAATSNATLELDRNAIEDDIIYTPDGAQDEYLLPSLPPVRPPQHWSVSSFSRLTRGAYRSHFSAASERLLESMDSLHDNIDEGDTGASIHQFARGREAGNLLHDLLEKLCLRGFANQNEAAIQQWLDTQLHAQWQESKALLGDWLTRLIHTPLPIGTTHAALAEVPSALPESEFWLRLQHSHASELDTLAQQLLPGERASLSPQQLNGILKGFIDLLFEVDGRFYVLDYKSNYLGADASAYTQQAMQQAMLDHRYELQALIYQLALHRLLRERLPDYDPAKHLGGSVFFFLRGIDSETRGICHLPMDAALIKTVDALFDEKGALA